MLQRGTHPPKLRRVILYIWGHSRHALVEPGYAAVLVTGLDISGMG